MHYIERVRLSLAVSLIGKCPVMVNVTVTPGGVKLDTSRHRGLVMNCTFVGIGATINDDPVPTERLEGKGVRA